MTIDSLGRWGQIVFSAFVCIVFGLLLGVLLYTLFEPADLPPGVREVLLVLVGVLAREFGNVGSFWLGTSLSSAKKDATIAAAMQNLPQ